MQNNNDIIHCKGHKIKVKSKDRGMLKVHYNDYLVEIPLSTKIDDLSNLISRQINTINVFHKLYFRHRCVKKSRKPINIQNDHANYNEPIYKLYAQCRNESMMGPKIQDNKIIFPRTGATISIENVDQLKSHEIIRSDNEYYVVTKQSDILLKFNKNDACVKIGFDGLDVISDKTWEKSMIQKNPQNYIAMSLQQMYRFKLKSNELDINDQFKKMSISVSVPKSITFEVFSTYETYNLSYSSFYVPGTNSYKPINYMKSMSQLKIDHLIIYIDNFDDNFTLYDYGIRENDIVEIGPCLKKFQIIVKKSASQCELYPKKNNEIYDSTYNLSTDELAHMIYLREGIPIKQQRLVYMGININISKHETLHDYNILEESTIYVTTQKKENDLSIVNHQTTSNELENNIYYDYNHSVYDYDPLSVQEFTIKLTPFVIDKNVLVSRVFFPTMDQKHGLRRRHIDGRTQYINEREYKQQTKKSHNKSDKSECLIN